MTSPSNRMSRPRSPRFGAAFLSAGALTATLVGCNSTGDPVGSTSSVNDSGSASPALSGSITVFAAASLTDAFAKLGTQFEAANPGVTVTFSFGASSALAEQINAGAPADVFASASESTMEQVVDAGNATDPMTFATNVMQIAVLPTNPANVTGIDDLADSAVKVALCQPRVPCGSVAADVFTNAGITVTPVTLEPDVRAVLSKVQLGEVDAGVVYLTDVLAAGGNVQGVEIAADVNASTFYPIAELTNTGNLATAEAFDRFVLSAGGRRVLADFGFGTP
jgi:molybdate transport system substrate-binding protein